MQSLLDHKQILSAAEEVAQTVLKHTHSFIEASNILKAARAAIAGGIKDVPFRQEGD
jgi:hypothetical protein